VEETVLADLDHRNLNLDVPWLSGVNPTTENLVVAIWQRLAGELPPPVRLVRLVLWETPRNYVEYTGE
jgi:6-pyruvoyltetrahydropterin/6-carboxytetrahydropterin synthase